MKVIIVGGVAGGASCAARLRRLDEDAEIIMVEKAPQRGVDAHVVSGGMLSRAIVSMK